MKRYTTTKEILFYCTIEGYYYYITYILDILYFHKNNNSNMATPTEESKDVDMVDATATSIQVRSFV